MIPGGPTKGKVSESSVRRLSGYHRILEDLERQGVDLVSSQALAELAGTNSAQIRKDLSYFGTFGKRGSGYRVSELRAQIHEILGLTKIWKVALVGAGNLGQALFQYKEFSRYGFPIVAIFDNDPTKIGQEWNGIAISSLNDCEEVLASSGAELAVITTPAAGAQSVVERLTRAGIRGILNFAPRQLETPSAVVLRSVNLTIELEGLSFALRSGRK